jgi:hypothetical protein
MESKASGGGVEGGSKRKHYKSAKEEQPLKREKKEEDERINYVRYDSSGHVTGQKGKEKLEKIHKRVLKQAPWLVMERESIKHSKKSVRLAWLWKAVVLLFLFEDRTPLIVAQFLWSFIKYITVQVPGFTAIFFVECYAKNKVK